MTQEIRTSMRSCRSVLAWVAALAFSSLATAQESTPRPLRAGMIGLDTSHVEAFASLLNVESPKPALAGVRVTHAFPGGSPDLPSSRDRVAEYTTTLRDKYKVAIVDSIDALLEKVDVVFLESVDGRPHLAQARPVLRAHKPLFIDKPFAGSLADGLALAALARETKTPCFSSSSLRYSPAIAALANDPRVGKVMGCDAFSPCALEPHHPDLFWYGIHGVETLYTLMGRGCQSVTRVHNEGVDLVVGTWADGRVGTFRGIRAGRADYGALVYGSKAIVKSGGYGGYEPLVVEIVKFFKTHEAPVSLDETIEILAFMEAADESKRQGGKPVTLEHVLAQAKARVAASAPESAVRVAVRVER